MNKTTIDKIVAQSLDEISKSRLYKQGKIQSWQKNEEMYYSKKQKLVEARANVSLSRMQEFVHTLLSKIDNPLVFKFSKRKESQLKRVARLNALREIDSQEGFWDLKDIVGKKQAIIYGRTIYAYYANSADGYKSCLENVDVYDFLIDSGAGGIDIEQAMYMGRYNIVKTAKQLKDGIKAKLYRKDITEEVIQAEGSGKTKEDLNKDSRSYDQGTLTKNSEQFISGKFKFWEWFTTYEGERYYLLMTDVGQCIRCETLKDMFASELWPFWSYASFPDLTEFWTPSFCDYAREIFMAQEISINQMLDNAEANNKPQKVIDVMAIENEADLKYRRDGIIRLKGGADVNKAVQMLQIPSINTPIQVFNILEQIQDRASGVSAAASGAADESGKVGIYEGNQAAAADRFGLLNKSYSFGYKRFAILYMWGVKEHLTKKIAIDMIGPDGIETEKVSKNDIFRKGEDFITLVEASNSEMMNDNNEQTMKMNFLNGKVGVPDFNQKKVAELQASIVGFSEGDIKALMDTTEYGSSVILSEADRDIEDLLDGKEIKPNKMANTAYKQRFVDFMQDHEEDMSMEEFNILTAYIISVEDIIMKNMARSVNNQYIKSMEQAPVPEAMTPNSPIAPVAEPVL